MKIINLRYFGMYKTFFFNPDLNSLGFFFRFPTDEMTPARCLRVAETYTAEKVCTGTISKFLDYDVSFVSILFLHPEDSQGVRGKEGYRLFHIYKRYFGWLKNISFWRRKSRKSD